MFLIALFAQGSCAVYSSLVDTKKQRKKDKKGRFLFYYFHRSQTYRSLSAFNWLRDNRLLTGALQAPP